MALNSLQDLYLDQLRDLYSAEQQICDALPKMAEKARHAELRRAFETHLDQSREQARRLERICDSLGESPKGETCDGMKGLLKEGQKMLKERGSDDVRDAALIAAAQRVEHYEIAGYGCARTYAELLGDKRGAKVLDSILREEAATDVKLTKLARSVINLQAKKAPEKAAKKQRSGGGKSSGVTGAVTGAVKQMVEKVTG